MVLVPRRAGLDRDHRAPSRTVAYMRQFISKHAHAAGPLAFVVVSLVTLILASVLYFGAPQAYEQVDSDPPAIPEELKDHQTRGDMEVGNQVGATPNKALPRPDEYLRGQGISYDFKGSPNWSGRGACGVEAVVLHVTGPGSMAGMANWFNNPASQVSAHFGIGKNGEVQQYVELGDAAWQAGIMSRPDLANPLIQEWYRTGTNPNRCTVGIELLLGGPAEPLANYPAMQNSLYTLLPWILSTTGVPADRVHIVGHYQIDSTNRATDPICCVSIDGVVAAIAPQPAPVSEWGDCDAAWQGTWNTAIKRWASSTTTLYDPITNVWTAPPACGF